MSKKNKKFLKKISDLKNAYRVLEIMDKCGCDIQKVEGYYSYNGNFDNYKIIPKWWVTQQQAEDLRKIILYKENYYGNHHKLWKLWFKNIRDGYRYL